MENEVCKWHNDSRKGKREGVSGAQNSCNWREKGKERKRRMRQTLHMKTKIYIYNNEGLMA